MKWLVPSSELSECDLKAIAASVEAKPSFTEKVTNVIQIVISSKKDLKQ